MFKKIIYLFIYILCFASVEGQQQNTVARLLGSIKKISVAITDDSTIQNSCKKNINEFVKTISSQSKKNLTAKDIQQLIKSTNAFTNSLDNAYTKKCDSKKINSMDDSAKLLLAELNKLTNDSSTVNINFTGNNKNGISNWTLRIDSSGNAISRFIIKDSIGRLETQLILNDKNASRFTTNSDTSGESNFKITKDHNKLTVRLPGNRLAGTNAIQPVHNDVTKQSEKLKKENSILLVSLLILFILCAGAFILYAKAKRKLKDLAKKILGFSNQLKAQQQMEDIKPNIEIPVIIEPGAEETSGPGQVLTEPKIEAQDPLPVATETNETYFIGEIMMTAGPRKKPMSNPDSDKDLGEDVCGFISTTKEIFIWLLDGTSDDDSWKDPESRREYFSSRLLAQSIGNKLRNSFINKGPDPLETMIAEAIDEVKLNWLKTIDELNDEVKQSLKDKIANKVFPQCSTTALIGHLQNNGELRAYRTGDSQMFLFSAGPQNELTYVETTLMEKNEKGVDRIFFRLQLDADQNFQIVSNKPEFDIVKENNIHTIISFSDGIGMATELLLKEQYKNDPAGIKREIIYQLQGTGDDKSICFIERKFNLN